MKGFRLLIMVIGFPIPFVADLLGTLIGLTVKAFKEGYKHGGGND